MLCLILSAFPALLCISLNPYEALLSTSELGPCLSVSHYSNFFLNTFWLNLKASINLCVTSFGVYEGEDTSKTIITLAPVKTIISTCVSDAVFQRDVKSVVYSSFATLRALGQSGEQWAL